MTQSTIDTSQESVSEQELIRRILAGERNLFEQLIRRYNSRLYRIGMSILYDDSVIEDIMQNAYISAYLHLSKFEGRSGFGTWLVRIMINESLRYLRKKHNHIPMEHDPGADTNSRQSAPLNKQSPEQIVLNKELATALEHSVVALPEKYRLVFVMREIEQMSVAETMTALDLSESNVKIRLNRAKSMLRDKLASYYKSDQIFSFHLTRCDRVVNRVFEALNIMAS